MSLMRGSPATRTQEMSQYFQAVQYMYIYDKGLTWTYSTCTYKYLPYKLKYSVFEDLCNWQFMNRYQQHFECMHTVKHLTNAHTVSPSKMFFDATWHHVNPWPPVPAVTGHDEA